MVTTINYVSNNLSVTEQQPYSTVTPRIANKISNFVRNLYLGPGYTNVPGLTNLLFTPFDFYKSFNAAFDARRIGDKEGMIENGLRIAGAPFTLVNATLQASWYLVQIGIFFKVLSESFAQALKPLSTFTAGAGIVLSAIEGILEILGLVRSSHFLKEIYPSDLEEIKNALEIKDPQKRQQKLYSSFKQFLTREDLHSPIKIEINHLLQNTNLTQNDFLQLFQQIKENAYLNRLQKLKKTYFDITPQKVKKIDEYIVKNLPHLSSEEQLRRKEQIVEANLEKKKSQLIRRLQHRLTDTVEQQIPEILTDLTSPIQEKRLAAVKKAEALFNDMRTQTYKNLLINSIGLLAVAVTLSGLILGLAACPYLIPFVLLSVGGVLSFVRYELYLGLSETQGWHFDLDRCNIVKNIYRKIFPEKMADSNPPPSNSSVLYFKLPCDPEREDILRLPKLDFTLSHDWMKV